MTHSPTADRIRTLNDAFRSSFAGGQVMLTSGVNALPDDTKAKVLSAVRGFDQFDHGNDPHGEHDFGSVALGDHQVFFKIDYYDNALAYGSPDPTDPTVTKRVLTIMLSSEY